MKIFRFAGVAVLILGLSVAGMVVAWAQEDPVLDTPAADPAAVEMPAETVPEMVSTDGALTADQLAPASAEEVPPIPEGGLDIMAPVSFSQVPWGSTVVLGPVSSPTPAEHQVAEGEDMHLLAARYYGNARLWRLIFEANREKLTDPNLIPVGMILVIPAPET